jgi:exonuclease III
VLLQADVICLQETWLNDGEGEKGDYQLEGYKAFFNSVGPGKGVTLFVKEGLRLGEAAKFTDANIQLTKLVMNGMEIINIYRSQDEPLPSAARHLRDLLDPQTDTLIIGDFNICATKANPLRNFLEGAGFKQLVTLPTHIKGGSLSLNFVFHLLLL